MRRTNCQTTKGNKTKQETGGSQQRITPWLPVPRPCNTPTLHCNIPTLALCFLWGHGFFSRFRVLEKLGCPVVVRQRCEECDKDLDMNTSCGFSHIRFNSRQCTTDPAVLTAHTISSAAWLCKCHLTPPVNPTPSGSASDLAQKSQG